MLAGNIPVQKPSIIVVLGALAAAAAAQPASAQGKLEAHYTVRLAGLPIGKGTWVVNIGDTSFTAVVNGATSGLLKVITDGRGSSSARGTLQNGRPVVSTYTASIKTSKKSDDVTMTVAEGQAKDIKLEPPLEPSPDRVEVTDAHRTGILDPMAAAIVRVPGEAPVLGAEACNRSVAVFDGRLRYDLKLSFKRMDNVKAARGYSGPVVVCEVAFTPVAGFNPNRYAIKYITNQRAMEVWLAPIAGTRVMVPFRFESPTPVGAAVLEATEFVTTASAASVGGATKSVKN